MDAPESSTKNRKRPDRPRSSPPRPGAPASPTDGPSDEAGAERIMSSSDSLRLDHARQLRDLLQRFAAKYNLEEHLSRAGRPKSYVEGTAAACTLCADPGPVIGAFLSTLETAIEHAETAEVVDRG